MSERIIHLVKVSKGLGRMLGILEPSYNIAFSFSPIVRTLVLEYFSVGLHSHWILVVYLARIVVHEQLL